MRHRWTHNAGRYLTLALLLGVQMRAGAAVMQADWDTLSIVCFGNSTTAPRKNIESVYPERVGSSLEKAGIPCRVYNEGKGGSHAGSLSDNAFHRIPHGMDRFRSSVLDRRPDWVVISFGINDSWQDKGEGTPSRLSLQRFRECLQSFADGIDSVGGRTIIMGPNPLGKRYEPYRHERLKRYRDACRKTARKSHAYWIDKWRLFEKAARRDGTDVDALLLDGMHPNDEGHRLVAAEIVRIITKKQRP